jgi:hypothetical protein
MNAAHIISLGSEMQLLVGFKLFRFGLSLPFRRFPPFCICCLRNTSSHFSISPTQ